MLKTSFPSESDFARFVDKQDTTFRNAFMAKFESPSAIEVNRQKWSIRTINKNGCSCHLWESGTFSAIKQTAEVSNEYWIRSEKHAFANSIQSINNDIVEGKHIKRRHDIVTRPHHLDEILGTVDSILGLSLARRDAEGGDRTTMLLSASERVVVRRTPMTFIPNAFAILAVERPMSPSPTTPIVRPMSSSTANSSHFFSAFDLSSLGRFLAK